MLPPDALPDRERGRKLSFERAVAYAGGSGALITQEAWEAVEAHTRHYLWKYTGHCYCTACGADVGDLRARHGAEVSCPSCRQAAQFRHVARGHKRLFDEFVVYDWRKSPLNPEAVVLTAVSVWRDSRHEHPENAYRHVKCSALYVFRANQPTTVYKNHHWYRDDDGREHWYEARVTPEHNFYTESKGEVVTDGLRFRVALEGTAIGRVYGMIADSWDNEAARLRKVANAARRPWLEYIYKSGQTKLAEELGGMDRIGLNVIPNPRARTPREMLGLTEGQWYEARREGRTITAELLMRMSALRRMGMGGMKLREVEALRTKAWRLQGIAPEKEDADYPSIRALTEGVPGKLRRRVYRRLMGPGHWEYPHEDGTLGDWRDYYRALRALGEDMTDAALMLPKNFREMHDRMTERLALKTNAEKAAALREKETVFWRERLPGLRELYGFTACGLTLRPYESAEEIMNEGTLLKICIGTYVERYLDGKTMIACLRRAEEPDVPWRAVEFDPVSGAVRQDRGYQNRDARAEGPGVARQVGLFWRRYQQRRRAREREKVRITA